MRARGACYMALRSVFLTGTLSPAGMTPSRRTGMILCCTHPSSIRASTPKRRRVAVDEVQQRPRRTGRGNVRHQVPALVAVGPVQSPGAPAARRRWRCPTQLGDRAAAPLRAHVRPSGRPALHDGDASPADTAADLDVVVGVRRHALLAVADDLAKMQLGDGRQPQHSFVSARVGGTAAVVITLSAPEPNSLSVHTSSAGHLPIALLRPAEVYKRRSASDPDPGRPPPTERRLVAAAAGGCPRRVRSGICGPVVSLMAPPFRRAPFPSVAIAPGWPTFVPATSRTAGVSQFTGRRRPRLPALGGFLPWWGLRADLADIARR